MTTRLLLGRRHFSRNITSCAVAALLHLSVVSYPASVCALHTGEGSQRIGNNFSTTNSVAKTSLAFTHGAFFHNTDRVHSSRKNTMSTAATTEDTSSTFSVTQIPCLDDNYGYLIHDETTGDTAAIDTPSAEAYKSVLKKRGWKLTHILNTHHHWDHTGGNIELKAAGVKVYGPSEAKGKIPGIDETIGDGATLTFGGRTANVIDVGGHTMGHIAYHFPEEKTVFVGDALFALGCGRMFEGTPAQFWTSLKKLRNLPDDTTVYCAHEYTAANAKFAKSVEPGNAELMTRIDEIVAKRSRGEPTVPSMMGVEKSTNPFLRVDISEEIRRNVGATANDSDVDVFAKVRRAKDTFRG